MRSLFMEAPLTGLLSHRIRYGMWERVHDWVSQPNFVESSLPHDPVRTLLLWKPPEPGWIKINIDAAFKDLHTAIGLIARNHGGQVCDMITRTGRLSSAAEAEVWAFEIDLS